MTGPDFTQTATAQANRQRKAQALVRSAIWLGATDLTDLDDLEQREEILTHCRQANPSIRKASDATWAVAREIRAQTTVHRLPPGDDGTGVRCGCTAHPVTRVLYQSLVMAPGTRDVPVSGWPCPHPDPTAAPAQASTETTTDASTARAGEPIAALADWDDGSEPDWAALHHAQTTALSTALSSALTPAAGGW